MTDGNERNTGRRRDSGGERGTDAATSDAGYVGGTNGEPGRIPGIGTSTRPDRSPNNSDTGISERVQPGIDGSERRGRGRPRGSSGDRTANGRDTAERTGTRQSADRESAAGRASEDDSGLAPDAVGINPETATVSFRGSGVYKQLWELLFAVPAMTGLGDHWPLAEQEAKILGEVTNAWVKSLPTKGKARIIKQLTGLVPAVSFALTLATLTYTRAVKTFEIRAHTSSPAQSFAGVSRPSETSISEGTKLSYWDEFRSAV